MSEQRSGFDAETFWSDPTADDEYGALSAALEAMGAEPVGDERSRSAPIIGARRRRSVRVMVAAAAACLLAVASVVALAVLDGDDAVVIAAAEGVSFVSSDGDVIAADAGTAVPDDVVVVVTGFVDVGDGRQGPGRYRLRGDRLVPIGSADETPAPGDGTAPATPDTSVDTRVVDSTPPTEPTAPTVAAPSTRPGTSVPPGGAAPSTSIRPTSTDGPATDPDRPPVRTTDVPPPDLGRPPEPVAPVSSVRPREPAPSDGSTAVDDGSSGTTAPATSAPTITERGAPTRSTSTTVFDAGRDR